MTQTSMLAGQKERVLPTYYFDVYDDERLQPDDFGVELADLSEAQIQAIALLPHMARDAVPDGDHHVFQVVVKCQERHIRYVAKMTMEGTWVEPPTCPEPDPGNHGMPVDASPSVCHAVADKRQP